MTKGDIFNGFLSLRILFLNIQGLRRGECFADYRFPERQDQDGISSAGAFCWQSMS
jgi:hypothetical protein